MLEIFYEVQQWFWILFVSILGVIIGSFLNVVIYRLHTNKSLSGRSHCLSCGATLKPYDLIPVVSYLWLRGRCRVCGCSFSPRYVLVEAMTGALFVLGFLFSGSLTDFLIFCLVTIVLVVIAVYDYYHLIIPDKLVMWLLGIATFWLLYQFFSTELALSEIAYILLAALLAAGFFAGLWIVSKGRWIGLGDAKLVFPLCLLLSYKIVFSFVVVSFWIGAVVSLLLLGILWVKKKRGKPHLRFSKDSLTIKSEIPFAPFIIVSFFIVYLFGVNVLDITAQFLLTL